MSSLYEILGVPTTASPATIRGAYMAKVASSAHPDNGGNTLWWSGIQKAYDTLIDGDSRAEYDGEPGEEAEEDGYSEHDTAWEAELPPFDMAETLGVSLSDDGEIAGGGSRLRSRFYLLAVKRRPFDAERYDTPDEYLSAVTYFRQVAVAFATLKDDERRRIYCSCGFERFRKSEEYQENSVFELDAQEVCRDFFNGVDEADRDFLLLNSNDAFDDEAFDERCAQRRQQSDEVEAATAAVEVQENEEEEEEEEDEQEEDGGEEEDDDDDDDEEELPLGREAPSEAIRNSAMLARLLHEPPPMPPPQLLRIAPHASALLDASAYHDKPQRFVSATTVGCWLEQDEALGSAPRPPEMQWEQLHAALSAARAERVGTQGTLAAAVRTRHRARAAKRWQRKVPIGRHFWWRTLTSHRPHLRPRQHKARLLLSRQVSPMALWVHK